MATYKQRAQRGARLLDREVPGWANEINLDELDLTREPTCVIAQLYGTFTDGCKYLGLSTTQARRKGFYSRTFTDLDSADRAAAVAADYVGLHTAWTEIILERQTVPASVPLPLAA